MASFKRGLFDRPHALHPPMEKESTVQSRSVEIDNNVLMPSKPFVDDEDEVEWDKWIVLPVDSDAEDSVIQDGDNSLTGVTLPLQQSLDIDQCVRMADSGLSQPHSDLSAAASDVVTSTTPPGQEKRSPLRGAAASSAANVSKTIKEPLTKLGLEEYIDSVTPRKVNRKIELNLSYLDSDSSTDDDGFQQRQVKSAIPTSDDIGSQSDHNSDEGYQASDMGFEDHNPPGLSFYNTPTVYHSTPEIEKLLEDTNGSREDSNLFEEESPTLKKQQRRKTSCEAAFNNLPVRERLQNVTREGGISDWEMHSLCNSYVSQKYYAPSSSAVILPLTREFPERLRPWLDNRIAKQQKADDVGAFNSPHVLRYDPLEKLSQKQEKHEAARCHLAAELIFEQDVTGKSDEPYDHDMAGIYHFIPKQETDKWNDDSNFFITDKEFEDLIDREYDGTESEAQLPQNEVQEDHVDTEMGYEFYGPSLDDSDQSVNNTESSKKKATNEEIEQYQIVDQPEPAVEKAEMQEQTLNNIARGSEAFADTTKEPQKALPQTPIPELQKQASRLETASPYSLGGEGTVGSTRSLDSFKTACESPQTIDLTSESQPRPIPSFHTERPSTPNYKGSSKGQNIKHSSQKKSTKSVFALVGDKHELQGKGLKGSPSSNINWDGSSPRLRPLQPSPVEAYPARSSQYDTGGPICSPGTPTPAGRRHGALSTSITPKSTPQISQDFLSRPSTPKPKPMVGTFYPDQNVFGQDQYDSAPASYHANTPGGNQGPLGPMQTGNNIASGQIHPSASHMQNHMYYPMNPPGMHHGGHHQAYPGNMGPYDSRLSPGNWSSDSTISMSSQFNNTPGLSMLGYQPETPSRNEKKRKQRATDDGRSPSAISPLEPLAKRPTNDPLSDPRTPRLFDSSPIQFTLPPSSFKFTAREKAVITFRGHKECAKARKVLQDAISAAPEKKILLMETFEVKPTTIVLSGLAGNNIRGWVKKFLPHARVDISMATKESD